MGDALGLAGAAGGKKDERRVVQVRFGQFGRSGLGLEQLLEVRGAVVVCGVAESTKGQAGRGLARGDVGVTLRVMEQDRRLGDLERVVDFGRHVAVIERDGDEPGFEAGDVV